MVPIRKFSCALLASITLSGCGSGEPHDVTPVTSTTSTSSSTTSVETSSTTTSPTTTSSSAADTTEPQSPEPYVVECLEGTPGPALWSDGETRYSDWCFQQLNGPQAPYNESQSGLGSNSQYQSPSPSQEYPIYDTSGEAQAHYGCQQGYITDPNLCSAVYEKYGH